MFVFILIYSGASHNIFNLGDVTCTAALVVVSDSYFSTFLSKRTWRRGVKEGKGGCLTRAKRVERSQREGEVPCPLHTLRVRACPKSSIPFSFLVPKNRSVKPFVSSQHKHTFNRFYSSLLRIWLCCSDKKLLFVFSWRAQTPTSKLLYLRASPRLKVFLIIIQTGLRAVHLLLNLAAKRAAKQREGAGARQLSSRLALSHESFVSLGL